MLPISFNPMFCFISKHLVFLFVAKRGVKIVWLAYPTIRYQSEMLKTNELTSSTQDSTLIFESNGSTENDKLSRQKVGDIRLQLSCVGSIL